MFTALTGLVVKFDNDCCSRRLDHIISRFLFVQYTLTWSLGVFWAGGSDTTVNQGRSLETDFIKDVCHSEGKLCV